MDAGDLLATLPPRRNPPQTDGCRFSLPRHVSFPRMSRTKPVSARSTPTRGYSAPALEKGMDIVELLADAEEGLTVSEISQRLKRRMSELFRIIVVMERRNWLHKDPETSRYSVTYHVLRLAHRGTPAQT